eukprot:TRINITY_DN56795_c0_g1_i1.p1 TRINITY_DN56795_c0_g1~~TRINITY_DN56795_c0_g1_i1.p1  ORF type:complete len:190 (+),score=41.40 TRINITY_DN56795_c0_g1_i1:3-572(+)
MSPTLICAHDFFVFFFTLFLFFYCTDEFYLFLDIFFFFKQKTAYEMLRSLVGSEMCIRDSSSPICVLSSSENTPYRPQPPFMYLHSLLTGTVTKAVLEELVFPSSPTNASLVWSRSFNTPPPQSAPLSPLTPPYRFAKVVMNLSMMILEFTVFMFGAVWFAWEVAHFSSFVSNTLAKLRALQNLSLIQI